MSQTAMAVNLAGIVPVGHRDLNADDNVLQHRGGTYAFMVDSFGIRLFRYGQNRHTATLAQGSLASRVGDNNGLTSAGTLVSPFGTTRVGTSGLTASQHVGGLFHVTDAASSAGAAPEGEVSPCVANTATLINLDPNMPLSTALASGDTASFLGGWNINPSASGDIALNVFGVVMGRDGISAANAGWCQSWGLCNAVIADTAAITVNEPMVAGAGTTITNTSSTPANTVVGYGVIAAAGDLASPFRTMVMLTLDFGFVPGPAALT